MRKTWLFLLAATVIACSEPPVECAPACRATFTCVAGTCVSACNPVCASDENCTIDGQCVPGGADAGTLDAATDAGARDAGQSTEDAGTDASTTRTPCVDDADGDGIPDSAEGYADEPVDHDGDRVPDYLDLDSDNDTILDSVEWGSGGCDPSEHDLDRDGTPNSRDDDSDGDGVADACEARGGPTPDDLRAPLIDTDADGTPDYRDRDSDNDSVRDGLEDANSDCMVDANETDPRRADSDGDGVDDMVETTLLGLAGARDPARTPANQGRSYFVWPHSEDGTVPPSPRSLTLGLRPEARVDIAFLLDTTVGMRAPIIGFRSSLSATIVPALQSLFSDIQFGVASFQDVPTAAQPDDVVFAALQPLTGSTAALQTAVNGITAGGGGDAPQAAVPAIYSLLTGAAVTWPTGSVGPFTPMAGRYGALSFRPDALPFIVVITNSPMHNGKRALGAGASYDTEFQHTYAFSTYNADQAITQLNASSARVIGIVADHGARSSELSAPHGFLAYIADRSGSYVPPSAFSPAMCRTGRDGTLVAPDGPVVGGVPQCRLVMSVASDGSRLGTAVVDGIRAAGNGFDAPLHAFARDAPGSSVVDQLETIAPLPDGGTEPLTGAACASFPAADLRDRYRGPRALPGPGDIAETIDRARVFGVRYCFQLSLQPNRSVPSTRYPRTLSFVVDLTADKSGGGAIALNAGRTVSVIVPPDPELED